MVRATYKVELATQSGAFPTTFIDITSYVKTVSITRGRDDVLSSVQPGTCRLSLKNSDGRFSPANTLSPLYPNVAPMRAIKITGKQGTLGLQTFAEIALLTFDQLKLLKLDSGLFFGYIQSITPQPHYSNQDCLIELADGFSWLDLVVATPTYGSAQKAGELVTTALDAGSWPASARQLATGVMSMTPTYTDKSILSQIQSIVVENEGGLVFMDGRGYLVMQDQNTRFSSPYTSSTGTFTDVDTIMDINPERPVRDIANEVKVTYSGGSSVTKTDTPSQSAYGPRRLSLTADWLSAIDADDWASWLLSQKKDPKDRVVLTFLANKTDALMLHALSRDISDRITWTDTSSLTGTSGDYYIERIEHQIQNGGTHHQVRWQLSPVVPYSRSSIRVWWEIGNTNTSPTSAGSSLDNNTRLAY